MINNERPVVVSYCHYKALQKDGTQAWVHMEILYDPWTK